MQIRILPEAEQDIEDAYFFYDGRLQGLGQIFINSVFADIDNLKNCAGIHIKIFGHYRMLCKRFPFAVYYKINEDQILIKAVLDCRSNPIKAGNKLK